MCVCAKHTHTPNTYVFNTNVLNSVGEQLNISFNRIKLSTVFTIYVCMSVCLSIYLSIYLSVYSSIHPCIHTWMYAHFVSNTHTNTHTHTQTHTHTHTHTHKTSIQHMNVSSFKIVFFMYQTVYKGVYTDRRTVAVLMVLLCSFVPDKNDILLYRGSVLETSVKWNKHRPQSHATQNVPRCVWYHTQGKSETKEA